MSDIAIRVEGLGKQYRIGRQRERYKALRDVIADAALKPFRAARRLVSRNGRSEEAGEETIWALKNVSFEVKHGEVLGVIGRNGAGKSTLLRVLSRITEPTEGRVELHGRVGSLLEVGTGFHAELTGRENIYLNGSILGMKKAEIDRKFDEIVAFAEVEKFIDTMVKRYSSGMYLRLAFAVAAHLDPEILLVDEVLAVGDAAFQKRCLGKMGEVARAGRTVLLVSHNMSAITSLCESAVLLDQGRLTVKAKADRVVESYLGLIQRAGGEYESKAAPQATATSGLRIVRAWIEDSRGNTESRFGLGDTVRFRMILAGQHRASPLLCVVLVRTATGVQVLHIASENSIEWPSASTSELDITCTLPECRLYPGHYIASVWTGENAHQQLDHAQDILAFHVSQGSLSHYGFDLSWRHGLYHCDSVWETSFSQSHVKG